METTKLFHRRSDGGVKAWSVTLDGDTVVQVWGVKGGKMQWTRHVLKGNTRANAHERAADRYALLIKKYKRKGYVKSLYDVVEDVKVDTGQMRFIPLPRNFAPAKPVKSISHDMVRRWEREDRIFIQRKRDGMRHYLVSDDRSRVHVYSSGKDDVTESYKLLVDELRMPPKSILDCELVVTNDVAGQNFKDEFLLVSSIARSKAPRALSQIRLAEKMGMKVQFHAFDLLWWNGKPIFKQHYEDRYLKLAGAVDEAMSLLTDEYNEGYPPLIRMPPVSVSPTRLATFDEALARSKKYGWEGLVVWRKDQPTVVHVNGSPARTNCYKVKLVKETDVIATGYEFGKGRNSSVVGAFNIALAKKTPLSRVETRYDFVPMGRCGGGLDDSIREEALHWKYPCVIQIEYDSKSEKGFRFPVFIRKRSDKKVKECCVE